MTADVRKLLRSKADVRSSDILLDAFDAFRAGNGDNPRLLCQEPADGDTCRSGFLPAGKFFHILYQGYIVLQVLRLETGNGGTEIRLVKRGVAVEASGQHGFPQRTERYEADAQLLQRGEQFLFHLTVP